MMLKVYRCLVCQKLFRQGGLDCGLPIMNEVAHETEAEAELSLAVASGSVIHRCDDANVGVAPLAGYVHKLRED